MGKEFVMVPRELDIEGARDFYNEHWTGRCEDLWPQLMEYVKAKPAEQHQGEPVVLECWSCKAGFTLSERADCDGCCWKCGVEIDLHGYVEKISAEVERLRAEIKDLQHTSVKEAVFDIVCEERDTLRTQLSERGAQLQVVRDSLQAANGTAIIDTLWSSGSPAETLFDYIDAALERKP